MTSLLDTIAQSPIALYVADHPDVFPWTETVHVMALTIVFGTILIVDLRLMGLAGTSLRLSSLTRAMLPITWIAFGLAVITGSIMVLSNPVGYFGNTAFRIKLVLLLAAGLNMALFHLLTAKSMSNWDAPNAALPTSARMAGIASVAIWLTVITAGRWIGFTINAF